MLRLRSINCFSFASTDYLTALPSHKLFLKFAPAETVLKFLCQHPAVTFFAYLPVRVHARRQAQKNKYSTLKTPQKNFPKFFSCVFFCLRSHPALQKHSKEHSTRRPFQGLPFFVCYNSNVIFSTGHFNGVSKISDCKEILLYYYLYVFMTQGL